ncbi:4-hydroxy-tetrahydrodipicolinate reductase [Scrofimicrobium canadense]|nr:4-hydroxy-tetrahydrodipicolinate reductase [Scrofimicrobium canadense]
MLCGYGQMGRMLAGLIEESDDLELAKVIDADNVADLEGDADYSADVIIDFSSPAIFDALAKYVRRTGTALVSGTTGYEDQGEAIKALGEYAPVIYTENYSVGINVMAQAVALLGKLLSPSFDVEISETHHRYKKDAPSGTAQLLLRAVGGDADLTYGRSPNDGPRQPGQVGMHSLRGGTVPGEHTVAFFGEDEVVEITHRAFSRRIFALGALTAARSLVGHTPGTYTFAQLLEDN